MQKQPAGSLLFCNIVLKFNILSVQCINESHVDSNCLGPEENDGSKSKSNGNINNNNINNNGAAITKETTWASVLKGMWDGTPEEIALGL